MYETRSAISYLATTKEQKKAAKDFYQAIETCSGGATQKNEEKCTGGARDAIVKFAALRALL